MLDSRQGDRRSLNSSILLRSFLLGIRSLIGEETEAVKGQNLHHQEGHSTVGQISTPGGIYVDLSRRKRGTMGTQSSAQSLIEHQAAGMRLRGRGLSQMRFELPS